MSTQKMLAPEGMTSFSFGGADIEIPEDRVVPVSYNPALVAAMRSHGFTDAPVEDEQPEDEPEAPAAAATRAPAARTRKR
jgi:hypothetical protein